MAVGRSHRVSVLTGADADARPDALLAADAAEGSTRAFEALYRRHAEAAWRVASAVTSNQDDAADAVSDAFTRVLAALESGRLEDGNLFRSYLLAATRNAAIDLHRRAARADTFSGLPSNDALDPLDVPSPGRTTGERVDDSHDAKLVVEAFRGLPERWRSVLWLTEVEGIPPREAAALLGVTANNVAQLAVRARAGLRERFVQAHLRQPVEDECRFCVDRLGGYVTGRLSPRDLAKVDQHLAACEPCRDRAAELEDLGSSLRRIVLPLPFLLGSSAVAKWKLAGHAATSAKAVSTSAVATGKSAFWSASTAAKAQKPLLAVSTGILALGVISASVLGSPESSPLATPRRGPVVAAAAPPPQFVEQRVITLAANRPSLSGPFASASAVSPVPGDAVAPTPPPTGSGGVPVGGGALADTATPDRGATAPTGGATGGTGGTGGTTNPAPEPLLNIGFGVKVSAATLGVSGGSGDGSCSGLAAGSVTSGCTPPAPTSSTAGVIVATDGTAGGGALDNRTVSGGI